MTNTPMTSEEAFEASYMEHYPNSNFAKLQPNSYNKYCDDEIDGKWFAWNAAWQACEKQNQAVIAALQKAFDDRVRVIEMQMQDKVQLQAVIDKKDEALKDAIHGMAYTIGILATEGDREPTEEEIQKIIAMGKNDSYIGRAKVALAIKPSNVILEKVDSVKSAHGVVQGLVEPLYRIKDK